MLGDFQQRIPPRKIADYCYLMENGRIVKEDTGKDMEKDAPIRDTYLGFW